MLAFPFEVMFSKISEAPFGAKEEKKKPNHDLLASDMKEAEISSGSVLSCKTKPRCAVTWWSESEAKRLFIFLCDNCPLVAKTRITLIRDKISEILNENSYSSFLLNSYSK